MTIDMLELSVPQLGQALAQAGSQAYRAKQLAQWVYAKHVTDPAAMTNIPAALASQVCILTSRVVSRSDSPDGTFKLLIEYADGECVECVMIPAAARATACLSTQAGCAMGCRFCASGLGGLRRNLSGPEILQQYLHLCQQTPQRISNVVFMGMGEPLANYDATVFAVRALIDPERFGLSARHVSISTVGLPGAIRRLATEDLPITLAISLHAPNDPLRSELMPITAKHPLEKVLSAAEAFFEARRREITLEYILIEGVNDTNVCAEGLVRIARRLRCNVNLIRYNPVESLPYKAPSGNKLHEFARRLTDKGVNVNIRASKGADADAACGQLRMREG